MTTVLSIDWDYWFRDRPEMDWGHREAPIFIELLWPMRASDIFRRGQTLQDFGLEGDEWEDLGSWLEVEDHEFAEELDLHIAESHGSAYHAIKDHGPEGKIELINVDAHHDVKYDLDPDTEVQCDNWILALAREGRLSRVVQVYPEWRQEDPEADHLTDEVRAELEELGVEYEVVFGLKSLTPRQIGMVFFCRSGAWVPPWHDDDFMHAVYAWAVRSSGTCRIWNQESLEGFRRRFNEDDAHAHAEEISHAMEGLSKKT